MALLTKIKTSLAISSRRPVTGLLDGQYTSTLTGRSLDFQDLREYVVGDDVKDFDWKATARHGQPQVRRYVADRKHTVLLVVAAGVDFAGQATLADTKADVAIMAAGLMGYLATRHGDYVGLLVSKGEDVTALRPSTKEVDLERMLTTVQGLCGPQAPRADLPALLEYATTAVRRRTIMVLVVDDIVLDLRVQARLRRLLVQHELYLVVVTDLPPAGDQVTSSDLVDLDGGQPVPAFLRNDAGLADQWRTQVSHRRRERAEMLTRLGISHVVVGSTNEVVGAILTLLRRSQHAHRR